MCAIRQWLHFLFLNKGGKSNINLWTFIWMQGVIIISLSATKYRIAKRRFHFKRNEMGSFPVLASSAVPFKGRIPWITGRLLQPFIHISDFTLKLEFWAVTGIHNMNGKAFKFFTLICYSLSSGIKSKYIRSLYFGIFIHIKAILIMWLFEVDKRHHAHVKCTSVQLLFHFFCKYTRNVYKSTV